MRMRGVLLLLAWSGHLHAAPGHAARCRLMQRYLPRSSDNVWFLGSALPDTVFAGPGRIQSTGAGPGHAGPGGAGAFRGQLVRVTRLDPAFEQQLGPALRSSGGRMVLVGWDYDAACQRLPRVARADWMQAGRSGLFHGALRPRESWAGELPTLDVFAPEFVPYPEAPGLSDGLRRDGRPMASPEQLFEYVTAVPAGVWSAELDSRLQRWAKEHPQLAGLSPISEEIELMHSIELHRLASFHVIKSPIAGTWRIEVALARDTLRFFARTTETPLSAAYDSVKVFEFPDDAATRPPISYDLYSRFTRDAGMLDSLFAPGDSGAVEGYFELVNRPLFQSGDSTVWRGSLPAPHIARDLFAAIPSGLFMQYLSAQRARDSSIFGTLRARGVSPLWHELYLADSVWMADRFSKRDGARYQGRFVLSRDGQLRGEEKLLIGGALFLTVRAERISDQRYRGERLP